MLREKIRKLKPESAAHPHGIGQKLLQELDSVLIPRLLTIVSKSIGPGECQMYGGVQM
jgi:hypothetical protein